MIHLIYIYFIVNAFMVGKRWDWADSKLELLYVGMFGLLGLVLLWTAGILKAFYIWLDVKTGIHGYYMYFLTKDFENMTKKQIEATREIYLKHNSNRPVRHIIEMVDKKYNYGITRKEANNES